MIVLGIETSCDETSASIVVDGHEVRANVVASQIAKHAAYGGVIPELAAREHLNAVRPIAELAVKEAEIAFTDIDGIAVTSTPGLLPALLVGVSYAKGLAAALDRPLIGVNHMTAHVFGAFIEHRDVLVNPDTYPVLALVVSGGHTMLVTMDEQGHCEVVGQTIDDAAGEAFDKAAKILDLDYPGGPVIDRLARQGDPKRSDFPRALLGGGGSPVKPENRHNFSYSGIKTSLLYHMRRYAPDRLSPELLGDSDLEPLTPATDQDILDVIASYQEAVVDVLVTKTERAAADFGAKTLLICGGVACNSRLRTLMTESAAKIGLPLLIAPPKYCTDNAAMIAGLGCYQLGAGERSGLDLDAAPRFPSLGRIPVGTS
jgi:N6-L-threonylcarbamoyladenine synthase